MSEIGGGSDWFASMFYGGGAAAEDGWEDVEDGEGSLAEDDEYNAVQPTAEDIDLYAFVESVEPVYGHAEDNSHPGDIALHAGDNPVAYWIELDCVDCLHFDEVMAGTENYETIDPAAIDNISDASAQAIGRRMELWDELLEPDALATIYVYVTHDHLECAGVLADLPVGTWRKVAINASDAQVTVLDVEEVPLTNTLLALMAPDPYVDTFQILSRFGGQFLPLEPYIRLNEVFSLNHVPDIDLPDGGGGASGPFPVPTPNIPPPFIEYAHLDTFVADFEFSLNGADWRQGVDALDLVGAHFWGEGYSAADITIVSSLASGGYLLSIGGRQFTTRAETLHRRWHDQRGAEWTLYYVQSDTAAVLLPDAHCRMHRPQTPEHGFATELEWPPSPVRYTVKARA